MHLTGLHLLLTYKCTYECDHCFVWSSPNASGIMSLELAESAIRQAAEIGTIADIYFEGGEPFLLYPILLRLCRLAREYGLRTGIVTNSYFGISVKDAEAWLKPFQEVGLNSISVSDDEFHGGNEESETPAEIVRCAAEGLGIDAGVICIEPPMGFENIQVPGEPILGGGVRFRGRAVTNLDEADLPRRSWREFNTCPDEDFSGIGRLHLDPYGYLYPCQGIIVGNLMKNSLKEIADRYNPDDHPVISLIQKGGPAELVRSFNLPLEGEYLDACHLCYLARKILMKRFPAHLAPPQVYGE